MKIFIIVLLLLPLLSQSQERKIQKRVDESYDKSLKKAVYDSVFFVNGWLNAGDNGKADTRYPYLQFTVERSKKEGVVIKFDGRCTGNKYESTSDADTVVFEFENHEKIKLVCKSGGIAVLGFCPSCKYINGISIDGNISLNEKTIKIFMANPIYKISLLSSKKTNVQGELMAQLKYKEEIINCLNALMK
jgi:hypothetical protein